MSAQQLSDRCAELGTAVPRGVLANLETDRRDHVTVSELLVLAQALDVPASTLLPDLAEGPSTEIADTLRRLLADHF